MQNAELKLPKIEKLEMKSSIVLMSNSYEIQAREIITINEKTPVAIKNFIPFVSSCERIVFMINFF